MTSAGRPRALALANKSRTYLVVGALNLALALTISALAPAAPRLNDRAAYEYVGRSPFAPNCPFSIYCYRVLAPVVVHRLPLGAEASWRAYQIGSNAAAGSLIAAATASLTPALSAPLLASVLVQTSYGFTFTAYDPYAADPMVFLIAALLTWCWIHDRPWPALAMVAIGIFAKETVALLAGALALAAIVERRPGWQRWLLPALAGAAVLAMFHLVSRIWLNWEIASNPAAQLSHGSWIGLWWRNNPFIERKAYMIFATFGFGWLWAAMGWRLAPAAWRALALGTIPPLLLLIIAQTPERALGNAFFIAAPLAALYASRQPVIGSTAIALNALITAKAGTSSAWLPSVRWIGIPAAIVAIVLVARTGRNPFSADDEPFRRRADEPERMTRN